MQVSEISEKACEQIIERIVTEYSKRKKVHATHVMLEIRGACHTHEPTDSLVEGCAYCSRRGNVLFAAGSASADESPRDDVKPFVQKVAQVLTELETAVRGIIDGWDER